MQCATRAVCGLRTCAHTLQRVHDKHADMERERAKPKRCLQSILTQRHTRTPLRAFGKSARVAEGRRVCTSIAWRGGASGVSLLRMACQSACLFTIGSDKMDAVHTAVRHVSAVKRVCEHKNGKHVVMNASGRYQVVVVG
jgi:hypothetical protein